MIQSVPLKDLAEFDPPVPKDAHRSSDELVAFMPMADLLAENSVAKPKQVRKALEVVNGYSYFQDGDVLIAKITPCFENGKVALAQVEQEHGFGTTEFHVVRAHSDKLFPKYLTHFLRQRWIIAEGERKMTGSAGQRRIPRHFLQNLRIPLPPIEEQRRIAAILDKAEALRARRRQALAKLDTLTQSLFLEMFGDPASNPQKWPIVSLEDVIHSASDGPHVSPSYSDGGIPFLSTRHIRAGQVVWEDMKFISPEDAQIQWKKCKPAKGDVLYTKGGTTGLAAVIDFDEPIAVWVHVALLKPVNSKVDSFWLTAMLNTHYCYVQSQRFTHGIANRDLGLTRMTKIKLYLPPLGRQKEYVRMYGDIKRLRIKARLSLSKFDIAFLSLQHRAFRGEL